MRWNRDLKKSVFHLPQLMMRSELQFERRSHDAASQLARGGREMIAPFAPKCSVDVCSNTS